MTLVVNPADSGPAHSSGSIASRLLVLDTNRVLDWLLFNDPVMADMELQRTHARVTILRQTFCLDELQRVLTYPQLRLDQTRQQQLLCQFVERTTNAVVPAGFAREHLHLPDKFPRCRDADDQPFLALAYHTTATLITRDKALLKLKRKARTFGVAIESAPPTTNSN